MGFGENYGFGGKTWPVGDSLGLPLSFSDKPLRRDLCWCLWRWQHQGLKGTRWYSTTRFSNHYSKNVTTRSSSQELTIFLIFVQSFKYSEYEYVKPLWYTCISTPTICSSPFMAMAFISSWMWSILLSVQFKIQNSVHKIEQFKTSFRIASATACCTSPQSAAPLGRVQGGSLGGHNVASHAEHHWYVVTL